MINAENISDQGDWASQNKRYERSKSRLRESEEVDISLFYKFIDNYIELLKTKGFALFRYSEEKLLQNFEIYTIEDFYKSKVDKLSKWSEKNYQGISFLLEILIVLF